MGGGSLSITEPLLLKRTLYDFWQEFCWVILLSVMINLLMLTPNALYAPNL